MRMLWVLVYRIFHQEVSQSGLVLGRQIPQSFSLRKPEMRLHFYLRQLNQVFTRIKSQSGKKLDED